MGSVVIVGGGAIGTWLAVRLASGTDLSVSLLARPDVVHAASHHGLLLETGAHPKAKGRGGSVRVTPDRCMVVQDAAELPAAPDLVVVAVRAYQTRRAALLLRDAGVRPAQVLTLQNGLGNAEVLADLFGADRVLAGTTTHGVTRLAPGRVRHAGDGDTRIGPWTPAGARGAEATAAWLRGAGIAAEVVADPRAALWMKVAVNAAINPLSALHRVPNGRLLDGAALEADLRAAAREAAVVARAEGVALDADAAESAALQVAARTAENRSSMLQALEAGRPLETEAITGEVVRRGAAHGVAVPVNTRLLAQLRALVPTAQVER